MFGVKLSLTDSRGNQSITLLMVVIAFAVTTVKFLIAGMTLPVIGQQAAMTASEYGMAFAAELAVWLGREWTEKK